MPRPAMLALVLVAAALGGCLEGGEEIDPLETTNRSNATGHQATQDPTSRASSNGSTTQGGSSGNGTSQAGNGTAGAGGNGTGSSPPNGSSPPPAPKTTPAPVPWALNGSVELGYLAAVGVEWTAPSQGNDTPEDVERTDGAHCPTANLTVPSTSQQLGLVVRNETVDPDEPGAGAYTLILTPPEGDPVHLDWASSAGPERGRMNWSTASPAPGAWGLEVKAEGPVVQQSWTIEVTLAGAAVQPPGALRLATTCA